MLEVQEEKSNEENTGLLLTVMADLMTVNTDKAEAHGAFFCFDLHQ